MKKYNNEAVFAFYVLYFTFFISLASCSVSKQIDKVAKPEIINKPGLTSAHIGISIYDPSKNKWLYNYQDDKYFIPASNTKIMTCYTAMKYLGDSLISAYVKDNDSAVTIIPNGDPAFLHPDFSYQPLADLLRGKKTVVIDNSSWQDEALGLGWSWDDYNDDYMAERSVMPVYGNVINFKIVNDSLVNTGIPVGITLSKDWNFEDEMKMNENNLRSLLKKFTVKRQVENNNFEAVKSTQNFVSQSVPFKTEPKFLKELLKDTLHIENVLFINFSPVDSSHEGMKIIHSQPTDSLLKMMMHRSDNFFAEQSLLMISNGMLGVMNDEKIIDTLLKTDFKDLPQKPHWVDGSGLSRYNLFTPMDFVFVLNKMLNEFSWNRITTIFPTGGTGTLSNAYKNIEGKIFAKTGTLSNNLALSGYIITKRGKTLIFSVLVGNHMAGSVTIRDAIARFLELLCEKN